MAEIQQRAGDALLTGRMNPYYQAERVMRTEINRAYGETALQAAIQHPDVIGVKFKLSPRHPRFDICDMHANANLHGLGPGDTLQAEVAADGDVVATVEQPAADGMPLVLPLDRPRLWSTDDPFLYDLRLQVRRDSHVVDRVDSYFGMRKVHLQGDRVFLNNQPLYQRLVLDQGYYKDGIWTAPADDDLKRDIQLALDAGFNGARLHQKVFEERFHYWADKLGYLTWAESASWGLDVNSKAAARHFLAEWREIVRRDRNHPSVVAWTPLNETGDVRDAHEHRRLHIDCYELTHALDGTRPVNDASGYVHGRTDLWTVHDYTQDPAALKQGLTPRADGGVAVNRPEDEIDYSGQPYLVDEFGGIRWVAVDESADSDQEAWGYGDAPENLEAFYERLEGLVDALLALPHVRGYCYTQLTDVEQEQNGIYNYDRSTKLDMQRVAAIFARTPDHQR